MTYATILAVLDGGPGCDRSLLAGLALGRQFGSHVICLFNETDPQAAVPVLGEGMAGVVVEQMIESLQNESAMRLANARALFERHCIADATVTVLSDQEAPPFGALSASFRQVVGQEPDQVASEGHLVDLLVLPFPDPDGGGVAVTTLDAALLDSGRPVFLVPAGDHRVPCRVVTLGWDGSREAAMAASAALPFLRRAEKVVILSGGTDDDSMQTGPLVRYLKAHGVAAQSQSFVPGPSGMGEDLIQQTLDLGGDLLVMGAYGHSRLREMLLGGATHEVLKTARIPVLMAH